MVQFLEERIPEGLAINQKELGKVLVIASLTLLVVSLHSFYNMSNLESELSSLDTDMDETMSILRSDQFNTSLQALRDVNAVGVNRKVQTVIYGMEEARSSVERSQETLTSVERAKETYQWLTLFSLLGLISGSVLFLLER